MRRPGFSRVVILVAMISIWLPVAAAAGTSKPTVTLKFPSTHVSAGKPFPLAYSSSNLPKNAHLSLQIQVGTNHVWKGVELLKGLSGTAVAPGVPVGVYPYHTVAWLGSRVLAISTPISVYSYGLLQFITVCNVGVQAGNCGNGTTQVGTTIFTYQYDTWPGANSFPGVNVIKLPNTSCRWATWVVAATSGGNGPQPGVTGTIQVVQSKSAPQTFVINDGQIKQFNVFYDGGPLYVNEWSSVGNGNEYLYWNGSFSCYTLNGLR